MTEINGILLIDKATGWTSHDVVARIRGHYRFRKVGHCGTLDPNATGLLVLVIGKATKFSDRFMAQDKVYHGTIRFGETTNSYDGDGEVTDIRQVPPLSVETLNRETRPLVGDLMQAPPMVSAVKVDGVPLYKLARQGKTIERAPRLVHVYRFDFTDYLRPDGQFRIACTKGVYVRSLAHELGQTIGCGAHLLSLRRIQSGKFQVENALTVDRVTAMPLSELATQVIPLDRLAAYR